MVVYTWGVLGCGKIASDFVNALKSVENARVHGCAARDMSRAHAFAALHGVEKVFNTYEDLCQAEEIDIIYVATIHPSHFEHAMLALHHGKHVIVEKPMGMNQHQVKRMIEFARKKNVFLMEVESGAGMWTRFFPAVAKIRELLKQGAIGKVHHVNAAFGVAFAQQNDRIWKKELGGGGLLDIGVYPLAFISMVFGGINPIGIKALGRLSQDEQVDVFVSCSLEYPDQSFASFQVTCLANIPEEVIISGELGTLRVHEPFHIAERISVSRHDSSETQTYEFNLPPTSSLSPAYHYPGSSGFAFEIQAVHACLDQKLVEHADMPLNESFALACILDTIRSQIDLKYPQDKTN